MSLDAQFILTKSFSSRATITFFPLDWGMLRRSRWLQIFLSTDHRKIKLRNIPDLSIDKVHCYYFDEGNLEVIDGSSLGTTSHVSST